MTRSELEKIPARLLKALDYCESIPAGDVRQREVVPAIMQACDTISKAAAFLTQLLPEHIEEVAATGALEAWMRSTPHGPDAALREMELRIEGGLATLAFLMAHAGRLELGQEIGKAAAKRSAAARDIASKSKGKRGRVDLRDKALAEYRAIGGPVQTFARAFAERKENRGAEWRTVKGWIQQHKDEQSEE